MKNGLPGPLGQHGSYIDPKHILKVEVVEVVDSLIIGCNSE